MQVKVLKSFVYNQDPLQVGQEIDLPEGFAHEMMSAQKAERVGKAAKAEPMSTENSGAVVSGGTLHKPQK